jgi:hypothetical protein
MIRTVSCSAARFGPSPTSSKLIVCAVVAMASTATARVAVAEPPSQPPPAVDVHLPETAPPHRIATVEWNPLSLFIDRFSVDVVVVPGNHHALVVSPFYTWANTAAYSTSLDSSGNSLTDANGNAYVLNVPPQTFKGFGGELGYRYYVDKGGPRGFFAGPSLLLAEITATAYSGAQTSFTDFGLAVDAGYEALLADTVSITVGGGAQYTLTSQSIPPQQLPASIYANQHLYPRILLSFGYAF